MTEICLRDLIPTIKEVVNSGHEATFVPKGISMRPMLYGGRDEIMLIKAELPLKKYSLPLYLRKDGTVVLHRVVGVIPKDGKTEYVMRGDNTYVNEYGISDENIVAMVSKFRRNGKWISANKTSYRIYSVIWTKIYPLRKFFVLFGDYARAAYRKIFRNNKTK